MVETATQQRSSAATKTTGSDFVKTVLVVVIVVIEMYTECTLYNKLSLWKCHDGQALVKSKIITLAL